MKRALLVIDVQNVYFAEGLKVIYPPGSFENILKAMDEAASAWIPVIVIQHSAITSLSKGFQKGSPKVAAASQIECRKRACPLSKKRSPAVLPEQFLNHGSARTAVDTVVIAGYMTQMCCDTTARQAFHLGFAVEFLSDATGTLAISNPAGSVTAEELHRAILVTQAMRFSKVMTTQQWLAGL